MVIPQLNNKQPLNSHRWQKVYNIMGSLPEQHCDFLLILERPSKLLNFCMWLWFSVKTVLNFFFLVWVSFLRNKVGKKKKTRRRALYFLGLKSETFDSTQYTLSCYDNFIAKRMVSMLFCLILNHSFSWL